MLTLKSYVMKKITLIVFTLLGLLQTSNAQTITNVSVSPTTICAGNQLTVDFTATNGNGDPRRFTNSTNFVIQLSNGSGSFASPTNLFNGTISALPSSGAANGTIYNLSVAVALPINISGTGFKVRVNATLPGGTTTGTLPGTFTIIQNSTAGTASGNQTVCYGQNPTNGLSLSGNIGSVVKWQKSETVDFSTPIDVNVASTSLTSTQIGPLFNTTYFRAVVQNGSCSQVTSNNVTLTIDNTIWNGSTWSNGNPTACKKVIINDGGTFITGGTSISAGTLTVSNASSFTISSEDFVELEGPLVVELGSTFTVSNNSNLIQNNNVINQGTISVIRQSAPLMRLDYILWSAPVAGQNLLAFSPQTVTNRFYTYNPSSNQYSVVAPASNSFQPGTGYLIRMPNNHPATTPTLWTGTFTGVPNNGDVNINVTNNTYNAIGNPYPSTIDADEFISQNNISEALYFWRKTNNALTSSYATYTLAGGTGTEPNSGDPLALVPNGIIQIGQGFIVRSTSTQLQFNNSMRLHDTQNQLLRVSNSKSRIWLNIAGEQEMSHQTMIAYIPGTTLGEDAGYDGRYFNDSPNALTSLIGDNEYAIQARGEFNVTDEVPLGFKTQTAGNYTISIGNLDGLFTGEQNIYLRDLFFGTDHDLKASAYTFSSDAGTFNGRFHLIFQNTLSTPNINESNNLIAFVRNKELMLDAGSDLMSDVKVYDVRGSLVFEAKPETSNYNANLPVQGKQILLVQVTFQNGSTAVKKVAY